MYNKGKVTVIFVYNKQTKTNCYLLCTPNKQNITVIYSVQQTKNNCYLEFTTNKPKITVMYCVQQTYKI